MEAMIRRAFFMAPVVTVAAAAAVSWPALLAVPAPALAAAMLPARVGNGFAAVTSASCPADGDCTAVGFANPPGLNGVFAISQVHGRWGPVVKIRGLAALGQGGAVQSFLDSVSCWSPGNCSAGGGYTDHAGTVHAVVVSETNGVWSKARQIQNAPGLRLGDPADGPAISELSCPTAGNCSAIGEFLNPADKTYPFVVSETKGTWGQARQMPGVAALNVNLDALVTSLSCASPGNCAAAGNYDNGTSSGRSLVVTEQNGTWGNPHQVPGTTGTFQGLSALAESVSCPSTGRCLVVGLRATAAGGQPFLSELRNGTWSRAERVPGLSALPTGGAARGDATWVGCTSPGDCNIIGTYAAVRAHGNLAFSVSEASGAWAKAKKIPLGARAADSFIGPAACSSPGNCSVSGLFFAPGSREVFTVDEKNGTWSTSREIPGSVALNRGGDAGVDTIACGALGDCVVGGFYSPVNNRFDAFIATETGGTWGKAKKIL